MLKKVYVISFALLLLAGSLFAFERKVMFEDCWAYW